jgi:exocyst complex component 2
LALVGSGSADMASISPVASGDSQVIERLKALVGASRERCVTALCAAWNRDAENIKHVEDWHRSAELGDVTRMPSSFAAFEGTLLLGMQKILYISEAMAKPGAGDIVLPPPTKLLQMVRSQYVTTLYKALSGMVENAERSLKKTDDEWSAEDEWSIAASSVEVSISRSTLDAGDRVSNAPMTRMQELMLTRHAIEYSHAPYIEQLASSSLTGGAESQLSVRKRLFREVDR